MSYVDYFLLILIYCVGLLIAGMVYSEIWSVRLNRGKFLSGFNKLLSKSDIKKELDHIKNKIDDPNFEKNVGKALWESTRAEKGGTMKGIYAEQKEMMQDLGELGSFKFPHLNQMANELEGLINNQLIKKEWGEKFLKWASIPRAQPFLNEIAGEIFDKLDGSGNRDKSYGASSQRWL